jgi:hypothetical protein
MLYRNDDPPKRVIAWISSYPDYPPDYPREYEIPWPSAVDDLGRVYGGCLQTGAYGDKLGCRIDAPGVRIPYSASLMYAVDDEDHVAGTLNAGRREPRGAMAFLNGELLDYPSDAPCELPHDCHAAIWAFSKGAVVAVGTSQLPPPSESRWGPKDVYYHYAIVYTTAAGMRRLPDLAGGEEAAGAYGVSADGRIIGGTGSDAEGKHAVIWMDRQVKRLDVAVREAGGRIADGFHMTEIIGVSADGLTLAGNGTNAAGQPEGFVVRMPPSY